jgi:hypothetical protein
MLFVGALFSHVEHYDKGLDRLVGAFGPVLMETPVEPWGSDYYDGELGTPVMRRFCFFERLIKQDEIADIKVWTNRLEVELSTDSGRKVNLDPGYLTTAKVVLATTKDYSHRIYLGKGIFAEVALIYKGSGFQPHVFTYNDFRDGLNIGRFEEMREIFKIRLKNG